MLMQTSMNNSIKYFIYSYFKNILHRCDRAMIYIFIAGSYFPWFQLQRSARSTFILYMELEWIIWVMAAIGITYQQVKYI